VDKRTEDVLVVAVGAMGAAGGLQRMLQAIDRESAVVAAQQAQVGEHPIG
jgi:hypothetical protein